MQRLIRFKEFGNNKRVTLKTIIQHRVNTSALLSEINAEWGAEIDLRSNLAKKGALHLSHDPWVQGEDFEPWLDEFQKRKIEGPLIINTKEDGLEETILEKLKTRGVLNFFFLDTTAPTLVKQVLFNHLDCFALRLSQFEPPESIVAFEGRAAWIWVDCFGGIPINPKILLPFKNKYRICLVSPELHGFPSSHIEKFKELSNHANAVCTKFPKLW